MTQMPAVFVGHGTPMNAIDSNRYTRAWSEFAANLPETPRAVLAVSAHWYVNVSAITAMRAPRTIHDFYGFPQELFDVRYPVAGDPELAEHVADVVKPTWLGMDHDGWGIDHGTWSVLVHMFPHADVPVLQLSVNSEKDLDWHKDLGARLSSLRDEGVLILASGNVVHNLRLIDWQRPGEGTDWAHRFDDAVRETMTEEPDGLGRVLSHSDYRLAVPTPDHFLPLAYLAGLAGAAKAPARTIVDGYEMGSLSMSAYAID